MTAGSPEPLGTGPPAPAAAPLVFTCRGARSGGLLFGVGLAVAVETGVLQIVLHPAHPWVSWMMTAAGATTIAWLVADYVAMGRSAITIAPDALDLRIGRRLAMRIPRARLSGVRRLTWRDVPERAPDYANATRPATPNVLLEMDEPVTARRVGGVRKTIRRVGICLDAPDEFVAACGR